MAKKQLIGLNLQEIVEATQGIKLQKFAQREIALWLYRRGAKSFDEMSNISKISRELLCENFDTGLVPNTKVSISADGTKKYLFPALNNRYIETAYIPDKKRHTLCVSSQVGCKLGCLFCMTARQGFQGHLSCGEILNQILSTPERELITNLVFMGMGEPFDNTGEVLKSIEIITAEYGLAISPRKITVSTVGLLPGMKRFIEETRCQLAISMHSPFDDERSQLMPAQNVYPIGKIVEFLKTYKFEKQRRVSFEYILFKNYNDGQKHINKLASLLNGLKCRINLLRFHPIPNTSLQGTSELEVHAFRDKLEQKGLIATVRTSRGEDIMAACGLLSTKEIAAKI